MEILGIVEEDVHVDISSEFAAQEDRSPQRAAPTKPPKPSPLSPKSSPPPGSLSASYSEGQKSVSSPNLNRSYETGTQNSGVFSRAIYTRGSYDPEPTSPPASSPLMTSMPAKLGGSGSVRLVASPKPQNAAAEQQIGGSELISSNNGRPARSQAHDWKKGTQPQYHTVRGNNHNPQLTQVQSSDNHTFFTQVVKAAKCVVTEVKNLKSLEPGCDEDLIVQAARSTALYTIELFQLVKKTVMSSADGKPFDATQQMVVDATDRVKKKVLEFIESVKSSQANPFDFMTQQKLNNIGQEVAEEVRRLLYSAELYSSAPEKEQSRQTSAEFPTIVSAVVAHLERLDKHIAEKKQDWDITQLCINLVISTNELIDNASKSRAINTDLENNLRQRVLEAVNAARFVVSSSADAFALDQWRLGHSGLVVALKQFVASYGSSEDVKTVNARSGSSVREAVSFSGVSPSSSSEANSMISGIGDSLELSGEEKAQEAELKGVAVKVVDILTARYKNFMQEWISQSQQTTLESIQLIVQELKSISTTGEKNETEVRSPEKDDPIMKELHRVMTMKSSGDWQELSRQLKTVTRKLDTRNRKQSVKKVNNFANEATDLAVTCGETVIDMLVSLHEILIAIGNQNSRELHAKNQQFCAYVATFLETVKSSIQMSKVWLKGEKPHSASSTSLATMKGPQFLELEAVENTLDNAYNDLLSMNTRGKPNLTLINTIIESQATTLANFFSTKLRVEESIQNAILRESNALRIFTIQLMTDLTALVGEKNRTSYSLVFQMSAICRATRARLDTLLNSHETLCYIFSTQELKEADHSKLRQTLLADSNDVDIWSHKASAVFAREKETEFIGGTLNDIVLKLTNEQDSKYMTTVILTHQSFATSWQLFEKIMQRYHVPPGLKMDEQQILRIRLRVCVVLQYWIKEQFEDFDAQMIDKLKSFISTTLPSAGQSFIADRMNSELQKKLNDKKKVHRATIDPLIRLKVPEGGFSPVALIMQCSDSEIARQLTVIEFKIFAKIRPSELLNQAWNSPKLQYRANNVVDLITRANRTAFWVASLILWESKPSERAKVIEKMIQIAQHLCNIKNFNTLVAFIAGLNVSSISRLKQAWDLVEKESQENLRKMQAIFDPSSSYKTYRQAHKVATSKGPCLPYLPTTLSDLTFAEDGNPDHLQNNKQLINFAKREITCSIIIRQLQLNQSPPYTFPVVEPIHTFLSELIYIGEKDLYPLSLMREPRAAAQNTAAST
eukprot:TRINITY_DN9813_c0_g1_i3.p1 TRINITY_DN9813_c0_g1~~TRINITY_DN9813_c0_g1_i3.p1  ORF type:complete len:1246 (+),score=370.12 TRINITY_DN9813_c0_g1_i3:63-3800(+)